MLRTRDGEGVGSFVALAEHTTSASPYVPEAPITRLDWLNHWPLVNDSTSCLSAFPGNHREGLKSSNTLMVVGSLGNKPPILGAFQMSAQ